MRTAARWTALALGGYLTGHLGSTAAMTMMLRRKYRGTGHVPARRRHA